MWVMVVFIEKYLLFVFVEKILLGFICYCLCCVMLFKIVFKVWGYWNLDMLFYFCKFERIFDSMLVKFFVFKGVKINIKDKFLYVFKKCFIVLLFFFLVK